MEEPELTDSIQSSIGGDGAGTNGVWGRTRRRAISRGWSVKTPRQGVDRLKEVLPARVWVFRGGSGSQENQAEFIEVMCHATLGSENLGNGRIAESAGDGEIQIARALESWHKARAG
jgi:hypothetical protein